MIKWIGAILLLSVAVDLSNSLQTFSDELKKDSKTWHDSCVILSGVTEDMIEAAKKGIFKDDKSMQTYISCVWLISKALDKDFNVQEDVLKFYIPSALHSTTVKTMVKCGEEMKPMNMDFNKKAMALSQCFYNKDPEHFIMF